MRVSLLVLLMLLAACQSTPPLPTPALTDPPASRAALVRLPTLTPRGIAAATRAATDDPFVIAQSETPLPTLDAALLTRVAAPVSDSSIIGYSAGGRALTARRFGSGGRALLLVGGIHGGWEANTVRLMQQLIDHFTDAPEDIPAGASLVIVPVANPDGLVYGSVPRGRFNDDDVDLNRNWSCGWSSEAYWRQEKVNPGLGSFTEPETIALANYLLELRPAAALFYHSAANGVFAGNCDGDHGSAGLAAVFGEAAGYPYDQPFTAYTVTGVASDWADEQGIPAADVELQSRTDSEYDRNLRGILAVMRWLASGG